MNHAHNDINEIRRAVQALFEPGQVVELRALDVRNNYGRPYVVSGYFNDHVRLAQEAAGITNAGGVYATLNPCEPSLLARASNKTGRAEKGSTTSDEHVTGRRWLFVDVDPVRASGISSSEGEHQAALAKIEEVRSVLAGKGWPDPVVADSGNGGHLLYRVDLPGGDGGLAERCLAALAQRFDDEYVTIDPTVHNAARLCRLYGTVNRKGDNVPDRPHRLARLLGVPATLAVTPIELLYNLAAEVQCERPPVAAGVAAGRTGDFDLDRWIADSGLVVQGPTPWKYSGRMWVLPTCPFNPDHTDRAAFIGQQPSGAIVAGCHHNGCAGKGWRDLRALVEGSKGVNDGTTVSVSTRSVSVPHTLDAVLPPEPFPTKVLPAVVRDYVEEGAKSIGCPPAFIALPLLSVLAALVGNTRRLRVKQTWAEPAVLWTAVVGESGTQKSPALDLALKPLLRLQRTATAECKAQLDTYKVERLKYERELKKWNRTGGGEPPDEPERPVEPRYFTNDATVEALALQLSGQPRGILLYRDELSGWLNSFNAYKQGSGDVSAWLEMHRGGVVRVDRKTGDTRSIYVPHAAVSITGGIQPKVLRRSLGREHFDDGLAARFLLAQPPVSRRRWTEAEIDPSLAAAVDQVFARVLGLDFDPACPDEPTPVFYTWTAAAKGRWIEFYNEHAAEQEKLTDPHLVPVWSKLEGYAARLALVTQCVADAEPKSLGPNGGVGEQALEAGVTLARWFGHEARRVYAMFNETDQDRSRRRLVEFIRSRNGTVSCRDLQRGGPCFAKSEEAEQALAELSRLGLGRWVVPEKQNAVGRPADRVFRLADKADADETSKLFGETGVLSVSDAATQVPDAAAALAATPPAA